MSKVPTIRVHKVSFPSSLLSLPHDSPQLPSLSLAYTRTQLHRHTHAHKIRETFSFSQAIIKMLSHYQHPDAASRALRLLDAEQALDYERLRAENARLQQERAELERLRLENLVCLSLLSP